ncbi:MAG: bacterial Ig-like domain-containing protein [Clostridia bacterium]|nr:bacterial Ig-like domain-containing protein [Clostridia bacterium]
MKRSIWMITIVVVLAAVAACLFACEKVKVTGVEVDQMPQKTKYYTGEQLDLTGCTLSVLYSDHSVKTVDVTADMASALDTKNVGVKTVILTYTEGGLNYTASMTLHVISRPPASLRVATPPAKTEYVEGQTIDLTGLTVEVVYTAEQSMIVTERDLTYAKGAAVLGENGVQVSFAGLTLTVPVRVVPLAVVGLEAEPIGGCVYRNQRLHVGMFDVYYLYNDGTKSPCTRAVLEENGEVVRDTGTMTVHIGAVDDADVPFSCTVDVRAVEDEVSRVSLYSAPLSYEVGATFDWREIVLTVDFAHATGVRYTMGRDAYASLALSVADGAVLDREGAVDVVVSVGERTVGTFRIGVGAPVPVRWRVAEGENEVVEVAAGDVPRPVTLMLYAVLSDGTEQLVWHRWRAEAGVEVTLPDAATAGQTTAALTYMGMGYTFAIRVIEE